MKDFDRDDFITNFFGIIIKLDIGKLVKTFNDRFADEWDKIHEDIVKDHTGNFIKWAEALVSKLIGKMEELNPTLRNIRKSIKDKENQINILNEKEKELACWLNKISAFMAWKGNEY